MIQSESKGLKIGGEGRGATVLKQRERILPSSAFSFYLDDDTQIGEGHLLLLVNSNVNLCQKHPHRHTQK